MSKIVLICFKNCNQNLYLYEEIKILSNRLIPDNISPNPPLIINKNKVFIGIFNPVEVLRIRNSSVCMGNLIHPEDNWWVPMGKIPDGSYALFRSNENYVELVTDIAASRTIWYIQTENMFIASTSQRAIVFFLQQFKPNKTAFLWMLSSGTLGPGLSWDSRIRCLSPNARLVLDRLRWKLMIEKEDINFNPINLSDEEHKILLEKDLNYIFEHLQLEPTKWALLLSGGYDSRGILLMLRNRQNFRCITSGLKLFLNDKKNDAYIAKLVARHFNMEHKYFATDISKNESVETVFNRFLVAGEGRIDHISAYMDGFETWKWLFEKKYLGIIRGDQILGDIPVVSGFDLREKIGVTLLSDFFTLKKIFNCGLRDITTQTLPKSLQQREKESLATWRDRLYIEFRIPVVLAALNDLKCSYVEIASPLISRKISERVRKMPDHLRTDKKLWKEIVSSMSPRIDFAKRRAVPELVDILKIKSVAKLISDELNTKYAKELLKELFWDKFIEHIRTDWIYILRFRAYIICKMSQILSADAKAYPNRRQQFVKLPLR